MMRSMAERRYDLDEPQPSFEAAPEAWVARAMELPRLEKALNLLKASASGERHDVADVEAMRSALAAVGLEPDEKRLKALARLKELSDSDR
jgi:hypothetical protein